MEDINAEEIEKYIPAPAEEEGKKKKKKSASLEAPIPESLKRLSGEEVLRILDFLHRKYLSWMTEAEGAKYSSVYKSAKEEALREVLELQAELQKQIQQQIETLQKITVALQEAITKQPQVVTKSLLEDPRFRVLAYVIYDYLASKNPELKKYRDLVLSILMPEATQARGAESGEQQA